MPPSQKFADNARMAVSADLRKVYLPKKFSQEKPPKNVLIVIGGAAAGPKSGRSRGTAVMMSDQNASANVSVVAANVSARNM